MDHDNLNFHENYDYLQDSQPPVLEHKLKVSHENHVQQSENENDTRIHNKIISALSTMRFYDESVFAQYWAAIYFPFGVVLATCGQPFGHSMTGTNEFGPYRVGCLDHKSYACSKKGDCIGPSARVLVSQSPEWIQDVNEFNDEQYPQLEDAKKSNIQGSLFMPVIEGRQCIGVLEFAMTNRKDNFEFEMRVVCEALEVGFTSLVKNESINFETLEDYSPKLEFGDTQKKRRRNSKSKKITRTDITKPFGLRKADANPKSNFKKKGLNSSVENENINFDTSEDHSLLLESCNTPRKRRKGKSTKIARNHITKLFGLRKEDAIKICCIWYNFKTLSENTFTKVHRNYGIWEWPCTRSGIVKSSAYKALIEHADAFLTKYGVAQQTKTEHSSFIESEDLCTQAPTFIVKTGKCSKQRRGKGMDLSSLSIQTNGVSPFVPVQQLSIFNRYKSCRIMA
ncbi:putative GAF-like domain superfamily protein [Helianthus debilis subsp. tardiflorus]